MPLRLHWHGRFRAALGRWLGGDEQLGDRVWRRFLHGIAAGVLLYYVLPPGFFVVLPTEYVLLLALAAVLVLELLRHVAGLELPTIRPYEEHRLASFAYYAVALVVAVLIFPPPVASVVVLGTALVDPLVGELRRTAGGQRWYPVAPVAFYVVLGVAVLVLGFRWAPFWALVAAATAAGVALTVERPKISWIDDDIAMTLVPGAVLTVLVALPLGFP